MDLSKELSSANHAGRRKFLLDISKSAGAAMILASPIGSLAHEHRTESWTVGQIMDLFINESGGLIPNTVDTLHAGSRDIKVTGIVTTMFATVAVIEKAIELKANFIIPHEPTYYNHVGTTDWLEHDEVYQYKSDLLKKHNIAVWRNHDHIHRHSPDGVRAGVMDRLGWKKYFDPNNDEVVSIPSMTLKNLIIHIKDKFGINTLRYMGDLSQPCSKILINPGFNTGSIVIPVIAKEKPNVVIGGEFHEWEAPEYIRDAQLSGQRISLISMGHVDSEEPGSEFMAQWLKEKVQGVSVTHVPAKNPLSFF